LATLAAGQNNPAAKRQRVLRIGVRSDVRFILTDPDGRSAGFDRVTGLATTQIPLSVPTEDCSTTRNSVSTTKPCFRQIEIENPLPGEYRMAIVAAQGGSYGIYWSDEAGGHLAARRFPNLPISTGELQVYDFECGADPAADSLRGNFTGSQASGAADDLLTWGRPSSASPELPAGTKNYEPIIVYGPTVRPSTFRAQLDNSDITKLFHPVPGTAEAVRLPLRPGNNLLKIMVSGRVESHTAVDTDTLDLKVR
jgi:hypothetical protein